MRKLTTIFSHRRGAAYSESKLLSRTQKAFGRLDEIRKPTKQTFGAYKKTLSDGTRLKNYTFGSKYGTIDLTRVFRPFPIPGGGCALGGFVYTDTADHFMAFDGELKVAPVPYNVGVQDWQNADGTIHLSWNLDYPTQYDKGANRAIFRFYSDIPMPLHCNGKIIKDVNGDELLTPQETDLVTYADPTYAAYWGVGYNEADKRLYFASGFDGGGRVRIYTTEATKTKTPDGCLILVASGPWTKMTPAVDPVSTNVFYTNPCYFNESCTEFLTVSGGGQNNQNVLGIWTIDPTNGPAIKNYVLTPQMTGGAYNVVVAADWKGDDLAYIWRDLDQVNYTDDYLRFVNLPYTDLLWPNYSRWQPRFHDLRADVFILSEELTGAAYPHTHRIWSPAGLRSVSIDGYDSEQGWKIASFPHRGDYAFHNYLDATKNPLIQEQEVFLGGSYVTISDSLEYLTTVGPGAVSQ